MAKQLKKYELRPIPADVCRLLLFHPHHNGDGLQQIMDPALPPNQVSRGGFVTSERNLTQRGGCFVTGLGMVLGGSKVREDAGVFGMACVREGAVVAGQAKIYDSATVSGRQTLVNGTAQVHGSAMIWAGATVGDNADVGGRTIACGQTAIGGDILLRCGIFDDAGAITSPADFAYFDGWIAGALGYHDLTLYRGVIRPGRTEPDGLICARRLGTDPREFYIHPQVLGLWLKDQAAECGESSTAYEAYEIVRRAARPFLPAVPVTEPLVSPDRRLTFRQEHEHGET